LSERWWKHRKKRRHDPWFNDIFDEFDRIEHMMDEMMSQAFESPSSKRRDERITKRGPYAYGFSMTTGPDGKPIIKEYGNIEPTRQPSKAQIKKIKTETEPLIDILEQDKEVAIVAQLPGVKKEDIHVHVTETQTTISVDTPEHSYHKKLQLPAIVEPKSAITSYKNGVLQIRLQKMLLARTPFEE
jgi:HSP20 family protein